MPVAHQTRRSSNRLWLARGITIRDGYSLRVTFSINPRAPGSPRRLPEERITQPTRFRGHQSRALLARFDNIFVEDSESPATGVLVPARFRAGERLESVSRAPAFPAGARPDANRWPDREASEPQ